MPFVKLLHKALLNCLELGTSVPVGESAVRYGPLAVSPGGPQSPLTEVGQAQRLSPSIPFTLSHMCRCTLTDTHMHTQSVTSGYQVKKQCGSGPQAWNHTLASQTETSNVDSSPPIFMWGPFALEVVTVDASPCRLWRGSLFPVSWSVFSGQVRPTQLSRKGWQSGTPRLGAGVGG